MGRSGEVPPTLGKTSQSVPFAARWSGGAEVDAHPLCPRVIPRGGAGGPALDARGVDQGQRREHRTVAGAAAGVVRRTQDAGGRDEAVLAAGPEAAQVHRSRIACRVVVASRAGPEEDKTLAGEVLGTPATSAEAPRDLGVGDGAVARLPLPGAEIETVEIRMGIRVGLHHDRVLVQEPVPPHAVAARPEPWDPSLGTCPHSPSPFSSSPPIRRATRPRGPTTAGGCPHP